MYDELVKRLRNCTSDTVEDCAGCPYQGGYKGTYCMNGLIKEAADAIEEQSKPKWIPVTERLPKEGEFVLVYGDLYPNKHDGGVIAVSKRMDWNYWQGFGRERNITHWMPLPSTEGLNET